MALKQLAKLKMPAPKKDPMLELDEEMDLAAAEEVEEEGAEEEEAGEEMEMEAEEEEAAEAIDLSAASDEDLIAELEARGMSVSKAEEAASEEE
jgi:hypothetical protein